MNPLLRAAVASTTQRKALRHKQEEDLRAHLASNTQRKALVGRSDGNGFFSVIYNRLNASNGECCLFPQISIKWGEKWQHYSDFATGHDGYKIGFDRIVTLFTTKPNESAA